MQYDFTPHARKRMRERAISEKQIYEALREPTKIVYDTYGRTLMKKLYSREGRERLLLIVVEPKGHGGEIITVIDTSKVKKYL